MTQTYELSDMMNASDELGLSSGALFRSNEWTETNKVLPLTLGEGTEGNIVTLDLAKAPHVLVAGMPETGKSTLLHQFIWSLIFKHTPDELRLVLADFKHIEFASYENLPYLHFPVIHKPAELLGILKWLTEEME